MNQQIINILYSKAEDSSGDILFNQDLSDKFNLQRCLSEPTSIQKYLEKVAVDIVVIDISKSVAHYTSLIKEMLANHPSLNLLVYTTSNHSMDVINAFRMGVKGYLLKPKTSKEVLSYIEMVSHGNIVLDESLAHDFQSSLQSPIQEHFFSELTHRENQIIWLVAQGLKNKDIANECDISEKTVRNSISKSLKKLGFVDRREAIKGLRSLASETPSESLDK